MPWIRFLKTVRVKAANGPTFEEGKSYDLGEPSVRHWLNRNLAVRIADPETDISIPEPPDPLPDTPVIEPEPVAVSVPDEASKPLETVIRRYKNAP